jgi:hypothetical protein
MEGRKQGFYSGLRLVYEPFIEERFIPALYLPCTQRQRRSYVIRK